MTSMTIDTLKYVETLRNAGMDGKLASVQAALAKEQADNISYVIEQEFVTKQDVNDLRKELKRNGRQNGIKMDARLDRLFFSLSF